ncbi:uncharacterized protein LOC113211060, partial [Frankliniella occidentalis]|uniref:Uncharacterized protein LOC113211060 n=1 Tax=Frankliniella occidentalis TaxID=133901 RepID=A0A9C6X5V9_FRAOC
MTTFVYMNGHLTDIIVGPARPPPAPSRSPRTLPRVPAARAPAHRSRSWSHGSLQSEGSWRCESDPGGGGGGGRAAHYLHPVVTYTRPHHPRPHLQVHPRPHLHGSHPHLQHGRRTFRLRIQLHRPLARRARRKVQRLVKYEHERWQQGWQELRRSSQDEAERAAARGPHQPNGDLDRVQDMFPFDLLLLYDDNPLALKAKGLMSRRNSPASKLSRALSTKTVARTAAEDGHAPPAPADSRLQGPGPGGGGQAPSTSGGGGGGPGGGEAAAPCPPPPRLLRQFIMEAPAQFTTGVQGQERHLFLFSDVLLVAKPRGPGQYKLKDKVRVASLWLTAEPQAFPEVCEVAKSTETSFVLGWPTTNVVATFSTQAARDLWWTKLNEAVADSTENEPKSTNIQVVFYDMDTNIEYCKTLCVRPADTVQGCIQMALEHLEMQALDPHSFQLWAKTPGDDSPYPLVGHERPFAIRMGCLRDQMDQGEGFDLDHCNNMYEPLNPRQRCQFILRNVNQLTEQQKQKKPKSRKSPMRLRHVFKRAKSEVNVDVESGGSAGGSAEPEEKKKGSKKNKLLKQRRSNSSGQDTTDSGLPPYLDEQPLPQGDLFGVPLQQLWRECHGPAGLVVDDIVGELAKPVMCLLHHVLAHGLSTQGIFRRSANQRAVKELRRALDGPAASGTAVGTAGMWEGAHAEAAAALIDKASVLTTSCALKEFLRCLPVPLLVPELCADWLAAHHVPAHPNNGAKLQRYAAVVAQLPRCHRGLLAYLLCLLHTIAAHSHINLMGSHNLGVVLAPSLLRAPLHAPPELEQVLTVSTPAIVSFLIDNCQALFGPAVTKLLGELPPPQDSGAEESDSLHSGGLDSLEHLEPCPPPRKDKMSLSRDSGLTMSDSQLFTPDEEESGSTSSSGSGRPANRYKLSVTAASSPGQGGVPGQGGSAPASGCRQYVRVYGGWEERRAGLYSACSSPRTQQLPSATSTGTGGASPTSPTGSASTPTGAGPSPFKREDWFRQRSALRRLASGGAGSPSSSSNSYSPASSPGPQAAAGQQGPGSLGHRDPAGLQGIYGNLAGEAAGDPASPTPPHRAATIRRLENARRDRLRRSASEESLLERPRRAGGPAQQPCGPCGRALPALPPQDLYAAPLRAGAAPAPRMARSRSAYHLAPASQRLSVYHEALQQDADLYGYACVRGAGAPSRPASSSNKSAEESYDSSTLSDDDSTPHVSRSNSRSKEPWSPGSTASTPTAPPAAPQAAAPPPPLPPKLRHLPPVHVELGATLERRGRSRRRLPKPAARSKSLPPPSQTHQAAG